MFIINQANIYLSKFNNISTTAMCEKRSKLTMKTPERRWLRFDVYIVNFEQILQIIPVFPLLILDK